MLKADFRMESGTMVIALSGSIDSGNAPSLEEQIREACGTEPPASVLLDCGHLAYLSSAGLRVILRLKKDVANTRIINVNAEVYDILEMTGFTELMEVQKAYRTISIQGCETVGEGANGKVYRIDPETIVKVYRKPDALPEIKRERDLARTAFVAGVPTAISYDVVRIEEGGYGSVFELLDASSYATLLMRGEKTLDEIAGMSIRLLKLIHSKTVKPGTLPDMKETALGWAAFLKDYLPREEHGRLVRLIDGVPQDLHILHGDYHINNIMLQNGESLLIDMDTICCGHPVFELASMYNAYVGYGIRNPEKITRFLGIPAEETAKLWKKSLELYLGTEDEAAVRSVEEKAKVVGLARIMRREIRRGELKTPDGRALVEYCRTALTDLLSRVDTLLF